MPALTLLLLALAAFGHAAFWVAVVNRWHATGLRRWIVKTVTLAFYAALAVPLAAACWVAWVHGLPTSLQTDYMLPAAWAYLAFCAVYGAIHLAIWTPQRLKSDRPLAAVRPVDQRVVDLAARLGFVPVRGPRARAFSHVPGNQLWQMHVGRYEVEIAGLSEALDGFAICHWSDLHFSGRIDRGFFDEVVALTNELQSDLLALTGDICDKARYIDWIGETLTAAEAPSGKYFILGNHDLRTGDVRRVRLAMEQAGFVNVGGRSQVVAGGAILVAGNERPWFAAEPDDEQLARATTAALRLLLAHTPDLFRWAQARGFDLMLAGHTHGGQVRFPLVGPVLCPSWHGTKYSAGFFHEAPTVLHVSRGTGSLFPLRLLCPPQITQLILRRAARHRSR